MGYMKERSSPATRARLEAIERGDQAVVGVNRFIETEASPLTDGRRHDHDRAA